MLVNENLSPKWIFTHVDSLLWFEERLAGELLLASLLSSFHDSRALFLNSSDQTFKSSNKVLPVVLSDGAADLVTSRVIRQLQVHILEIVRLMLFIELFP